MLEYSVLFILLIIAYPAFWADPDIFLVIHILMHQGILSY